MTSVTLPGEPSRVKCLRKNRLLSIIAVPTGFLSTYAVKVKRRCTKTTVTRCTLRVDTDHPHATYVQGMASRPIERFYVELGSIVREKRVALGWTQQQLGNRMTPTVTRAHVWNLESGTQRIPAHLFAQLCVVLGLDAGEVIRSIQQSESQHQEEREQDRGTTILIDENTLGLSPMEFQAALATKKPRQRS
jgi:transcriptional regulator with XRE-family HTH domain